MGIYVLMYIKWYILGNTHRNSFPYMVMVDLDRKRDDFHLAMKTMKISYIHMYTNKAGFPCVRQRCSSILRIHEKNRYSINK
jgi:hypothetical protein